MDSALSELAVRPVRPEEVGDVLALWAESRGWAGTSDNRAGVRALLERDGDALLVAELHGQIVGSLIAAWDGWRGNMYRLAVHPDYRRLGIALRLLRAGEERLYARGARRITALVWREDRELGALWARAGYQHEEGTARFVKTLAGVH